MRGGNLRMNPIKVFLSIFIAGIALTFVLGIVGLKADELGEQAGKQEPQGPTSELNMPASMQAANCIACHGADLRGTSGAPNLRDLAHLTKEEIVDILVNGQGAGMPGGLVSGKEEKVAEYLLSIQD